MTKEQKPDKYLRLQIMARVAYPRLIEKHSFMGSEAKYEACIILNEAQEQTKFAKYVTAMLKKHPGATPPGRNGSEVRQGNEHFEDTIFFSARSSFQPQTWDLGTRTQIEPALIKSGDYAIVSLTLYHTAKFNRICVGLNHIYKYRDTEVEIGNVVNAEEEMASFADEYADIINKAKKNQNTALPEADNPGGFYDLGDDEEIPFHVGKTG